MVSGGFVIDGRSVSLADITIPVLYFVGERDDLARPAAVRAVKQAINGAELHEVAMPAGHFGLVVGSRAEEVTWPTVIEWLRWREDEGPRPQRLRSEIEPEVVEEAWEELEFDLKLVVNAAQDGVGALLRRLNRKVDDAVETAQALRVQLPRLGRLERMEADTEIGMAKVLAERAAENPEQTFFLWKGRAFTYRDADERVTNIAKGLVSLGVRHGDRVALWMTPRPSFLTALAALNRLGAVAVLLRPDCDEAEVREALALSHAERVLVDPEHALRAPELGVEDVWCLGGGPARSLEDIGVPEFVVDMEGIEPDRVQLPGDVAFDAGKARDLAMVLLTPGKGQASLRAARITNGRWAFSALGTAAAATLTEDDTVYSALPLHHAAGVLVATGSALVSGARLALSTASLRKGAEASTEEFWSEVRRYGASVVYYAGEMCRPLVNAPVRPGERNNPVRLFAGSGMRRAVGRRLVHRFDVGVLEFYASTEASAVLANASGEKPGLGRPLPGTPRMELVALDVTTGDVCRDADGMVTLAEPGEPGLLLVAVDEKHPSVAADPRFEGQADARMWRNVFRPGDLFFSTGDVLVRDEDGDYAFRGRLRDVVVGRTGLLFSRPIEEALDELGAVALSAAFAEEGKMVAVVVPRKGRSIRREELEQAFGELPEGPAEVRLLDGVQLSEGYRPRRASLAAKPQAVFVFE